MALKFTPWRKIATTSCVAAVNTEKGKLIIGEWLITNLVNINSVIDDSKKKKKMGGPS